MRQTGGSSAGLVDRESWAALCVLKNNCLARNSLQAIPNGKFSADRRLVGIRKFIITFLDWDNLMVRLLILLSLLPWNFVRAQVDSSFVDASRQHALEQYDTYFENQSRLYNGSQYREPVQTNDTHPFFPHDDWQRADIEYDGLVFKDVDVLYDVHTDKLVIEYFNGNMVELIRDKVKGFTIGSRVYRNFGVDRDPTLPWAGFYEVLLDGEFQCLARRSKEAVQSIEDMTVEITYRDKTAYFVRRDGVYYPVRSKRSLLKLFIDEKSALRHYIKRDRISFKRDPDTALVKVVKRYKEIVVNP